MRSQCAAKSSPCSPQLEKAHTKQQRPSTAKKKKKKKESSSVWALELQAENDVKKVDDF